MKAEGKINIGVLGIGAIGSVISVLLRDNPNHQIYYFNRSNKSRLKVIALDQSNDVPIQVHTSAPDIPDLDWLIICLKAYHFADAKSWFQALIRVDTKVVVIRNGMRLKEPLLDFTDKIQILECIINCPTEPANNGFYRYTSKPILSVPDHPLSKSFSELFPQNGAVINTVSDFKTQKWKKLCESATLGAILCLSDKTCWIFKDEGLRKLYADMLEESIQVAKADGANIEKGFIDQMLQKLLNYPATKSSSMLTDRRRGNLIEIEAKNGIISDLGKAYAISTPLNDLVITLLTHLNHTESNS